MHNLLYYMKSCFLYLLISLFSCLSVTVFYVAAAYAAAAFVASMSNFSRDRSADARVGDSVSHVVELILSQVFSRLIFTFFPVSLCIALSPRFVASVCEAQLRLCLIFCQAIMA